MSIIQTRRTAPLDIGEHCMRYYKYEFICLRIDHFNYRFLTFMVRYTRFCILRITTQVYQGLVFLENNYNTLGYKKTGPGGKFSITSRLIALFEALSYLKE